MICTFALILEKMAEYSLLGSQHCVGLLLFYLFLEGGNDYLIVLADEETEAVSGWCPNARSWYVAAPAFISNSDSCFSQQLFVALLD